MDEFFATILQALGLPTWALLLILALTGVAALFLGRMPVWVGPLLAALRAGAWAALRKPAKLAASRAASRIEEPSGPLAPAPNDGVDMPAVVLAGPVQPNPQGPTPFANDNVDMPTVELAGPVKPNPTPPRGFANDGVDTP